MTTLRRIEPMKFPDIEPPADLGQRPELRWVDPRALLVDETYQRELGKDSRGLIKKVAAGFAWARMKPPIVVVERNGFHVIDGQHTAIAAASIGVDEIPVLIVGAPSLEARAKAFIGHNTDRIKVGPIQLHKSRLAAGDEHARDIDNVCRRAGVRIRVMNYMCDIEPGDTGSIGAIGKLIATRGVQRARAVLEALVKGGCAPIGAEQIRAADIVLCVKDDVERVKPAMTSAAEVMTRVDDLAAAVRLDGTKGLLAARATAAAEKRRICDVLAERWRRKMATIGGAK